MEKQSKNTCFLPVSVPTLPPFSTTWLCSSSGLEVAGMAVQRAKGSGSSTAVPLNGHPILETALLPF